MILYEQGKEYWDTMRKFNASKALPGMALHAVEKINELLPRTQSQAVRNRMQGFISRHAPRT